jgi:hypothetical protein
MRHTGRHQVLDPGVRRDDGAFGATVSTCPPTVSNWSPHIHPHGVIPAEAGIQYSRAIALWHRSSHWSSPSTGSRRSPGRRRVLGRPPRSRPPLGDTREIDAASHPARPGQASGDGETESQLRLVRMVRPVSPPRLGFWAVPPGLRYLDAPPPPLQSDAASAVGGLLRPAACPKRAGALGEGRHEPCAGFTETDAETALRRITKWPPDFEPEAMRPPPHPISLAPAARLQPRFDARMGEAYARRTGRGQVGAALRLAMLFCRALLLALRPRQPGR